MKSKFLRVFLAAAVLFAISALAQTGSPTTSPSTAPATSAPSTPAVAAGPTKVGTINIQDAVLASNEGRREMDALSKKYEPKTQELKGQNDELEAMKKQLSTQEGKLNEEAAAKLKRDIETRQKSFDRAYQDFQEEAGNAQQEAFGKILQKMAPMIVKYSQDNGFNLIVDTSKVWPQSPVLWWGESTDITKAIVDAYNVQSGVPAPAAPSSTKPPASKPGAGAGAAKPPASTPPSAPKPQ
jgi:Skp family chaperone for outer membrane proteins